MLRSALLALVLSASTPADYTECKLIHTEPLPLPRPEFKRQPDNAALADTAKRDCDVAPIVAPTPGMAANSTFVNDGEPPKRFSFPPRTVIRVAFGQANIDALCGRPPCDTYFEGCTRGAVLVLPDPFTAKPADFARIARHEIAHLNGWPATHGD